MKKTIKNAAIGLLTLLAVTTGFTAFASTSTEVTPIAELKMIGRIDNQPLFQLSLNNKVAEKFVVVVKDEFGAILHQETVSGVNIKRKYQLNTEELGTVGLKFEIISKGNTKPVVFTVQNSSRISEEMLIVKK